MLIFHPRRICPTSSSLISISYVLLYYNNPELIALGVTGGRHAAWLLPHIQCAHGFPLLPSSYRLLSSYYALTSSILLKCFPFLPARCVRLFKSLETRLTYYLAFLLAPAALGNRKECLIDMYWNHLSSFACFMVLFSKLSSAVPLAELSF